MSKKGSMAKKEAKKEKGASKMPPFNITEHKPMEEEMRKLSSAIEQSIDGIAIADLEPKLTYVNDAFARMHGYSREEMIGMKVVNLHNEEQMDEYQRGMNQTKTQGSWEGEIGHIRKDGTPFAAYMSVTLLKGDDGKPEGIAAVTTDITEHKPTEEELRKASGELEMRVKERTAELTKANEELRIEITERKRAEKALRQSEENLKAYLESAPDGVYINDLKGTFLYGNKRAEEFTGYKREELIGKSFLKLNLLPAKYLARAGKLMALNAIGKPTGPDEFELIRKDGSRIPVEITTTPIKQEGKRVVIGFVRDITKRKWAEQEIQDKNEQLQATNEELQAANEELREMREELIRSERLAAIGQLAGGVGHELRNPLGAIKNAAYYVKGKVAKSELAHKEPRVIEFLNIIDDEIDTSNQIINDLLGFSRVGKPSVLPTQIKNVIEDALSPTTIPESIKLTKKLDTELPQIEINASQIHQVLVNMITNAVQAMAEGGKLTIAAREQESFLEVEIADPGCGIPEEAVGIIFDPLFTTKAKGIGLGLAVCKTIIDRHEGKIEVKSQAGKGTTFTIRLPLKRE